MATLTEMATKATKRGPGRPKKADSQKSAMSSKAEGAKGSAKKSSAKGKGRPRGFGAIIGKVNAKVRPKASAGSSPRYEYNKDYYQRNKEKIKKAARDYYKKYNMQIRQRRFNIRKRRNPKGNFKGVRKDHKYTPRTGSTKKRKKTTKTTNKNKNKAA